MTRQTRKLLEVIVFSLAILQNEGANSPADRTADPRNGFWMGSAMIAVTLVGIAVGTLFRLKVLLLVAGLLLVISVVLSIHSGFTFLHAAILMITAQLLFQGSYFLGLLLRSLSSAIYRARPSL